MVIVKICGQGGFSCFQEYPRAKVKSKTKAPDVNNMDSIIK